MMGFGFGGGAVAFAQYFMKKMEYQLRVNIEKRKAGIKARHRARHDRMVETEELHSRVEYPCFFWCETCNYFCSDVPPQCPNCGSRTWVDLGNRNTGDALHDLEESERRSITPAVRWAVMGLYLSVVLISYTVVWKVTSTADAVLAAIITAITLAILYPFTLRPWSVLMERFHKKRPRRWHFPIPVSRLKGKPKLEFEGIADGDPVVQAPFSGTRCLGYKALVLFDVEKDARPPEWAVAEVVCTDMTVNNEWLPATQIMLDTPIHQVEPGAVQRGFDLVKYLRQRGLYAYDGNFWLYEAIISPGDTVHLRRFNRIGDVAVLEKQ